MRERFPHAAQGPHEGSEFVLGDAHGLGQIAVAMVEARRWAHPRPGQPGGGTTTIAASVSATNTVSVRRYSFPVAASPVSCLCLEHLHALEVDEQRCVLFVRPASMVGHGGRPPSASWRVTGSTALA
jgi:hypothetical protein